MRLMARLAQQLGLPVTRDWLRQLRSTDRHIYGVLRALLRHFRTSYDGGEPVRSLMQLDVRTQRLQLVWPQARLLAQARPAHTEHTEHSEHSEQQEKPKKTKKQRDEAKLARLTPVGRTEAKQLVPDQKRHASRLYQLVRRESVSAEPASLACATLLTLPGDQAYYATDPILRLVALRQATADPALNTTVANRALESLRQAFQEGRQALHSKKRRRDLDSVSASSASDDGDDDDDDGDDEDDEEDDGSDDEDSEPESTDCEERDSEASDSESSVTLGSDDTADDSSFSLSEHEAVISSSDVSSSGDDEEEDSCSASEPEELATTTSDTDDAGVTGETDIAPSEHDTHQTQHCDAVVVQEEEEEEVSTQY